MTGGPVRERTEEMDDRQFRWGLSGGASCLAIAGLFWFGISFGVTAYKWGWWAWGLSTAWQFGVSISLLWAAMRLRRGSGFTPSDIGRGGQLQRQATQRRVRLFVLVIFIQSALLSPVVWWCVHTATKDRLWPSIGLIVSLHFAPLARLFHVRAYYITALAGTVISLVGLLTGVADIQRLLWFGGAMAAVMWLSAWHIIRNADQITVRAMRETWAV
jgi:hypothetical protein